MKINEENISQKKLVDEINKTGKDLGNITKRDTEITKPSWVTPRGMRSGH